MEEARRRLDGWTPFYLSLDLFPDTKVRAGLGQRRQSLLPSGCPALPGPHWGWGARGPGRPSTSLVDVGDAEAKAHASARSLPSAPEPVGPELGLILLGLTEASSHRGPPRLASACFLGSGRAEPNGFWLLLDKV